MFIAISFFFYHKYLAKQLFAPTLQEASLGIIGGLAQIEKGSNYISLNIAFSDVSKM